MTDFNPGSGGGRPRGCSPIRLGIGILVAVIGIVTYLHTTTVNPTTGEKQHVTMTPQQESALGLQSAPQMAAQMGGEVPDSDPQTQEVQRVGNRIWHASDAARSPYQYQFHLLGDRQTVNAFSLPGGQVFITRGLLDRLQTEGQLAGVLAHETGHVVERHVARQMDKGQLGQMLVAATGVATSDNRHGYEGAMAAEMVNQLLQLHFSRDDESQADQCGLTYMTEAGYDPRAMLGVMKVLQAITAQTGRPPQMLQTHPYPERRIAAIQAWLSAKYPSGVPRNLVDPPLPWRK